MSNPERIQAVLEALVYRIAAICKGRDDPTATEIAAEIERAWGKVRSINKPKPFRTLPPARY